MSFAEDVKQLRGSGKKDDDILDFIADTSPRHSSGIAELRKAGKKSTDVLDFLSETTTDEPEDRMDRRPLPLAHARQRRPPPRCGVADGEKGSASEVWRRRSDGAHQAAAGTSTL